MIVYVNVDNNNYKKLPPSGLLLCPLSERMDLMMMMMVMVFLAAVPHR